MNIEQFFIDQLAVWPEAKQRYEDLKSAEHKTVTIQGRDYDVMFNPARMKSAAAKVEGGKVDRPCFLCDHALPKEQQKIQVKTIPGGREYNIMVNPFPITDRHFTIVSAKHERQSLENGKWKMVNGKLIPLEATSSSADSNNSQFSILNSQLGSEKGRGGAIWDMAFFADLLPDYLIFFNGAKSGASAPDHMHFQAVPKELVPITHWSWEQWQDFGVTSQMPMDLQSKYDNENEDPSDTKNVLCWTDGQDCHWLVIDRKAHRPKQYFAEGEEGLLISPASLEFCGLVPMARKEDYDKMDATLLEDVLGQCRRQEPMIHVGIMEGQQIRFSADERTHSLNYIGEEQILQVMDYGSNRAEKQEIKEYYTTSTPFTLEGVTIGKQFHWEQQEDQTFMGSLRIIAREGELHAINILPVEEYLKSVISSEMSATNNLELLKTHAIISRSWVMKTLSRPPRGEEMGKTNGKLKMVNGKLIPLEATSSSADSVLINSLPREGRGGVFVRIWDGHDHTLYDVCADDHCQRYQGITRQVSPLVAQAIEETRGMVLLDKDGEICDARFSKCCGGMSELFSTCWQDEDYHYLQPVDDPWCDTHEEKVLRLVLNDYDQRTQDFHDWEVSYTQEELTELFNRRMKGEYPDFEPLDEITDLVPVKRGPSGRIYDLEVVGLRNGDKVSIHIGKELLIRKAFSESHLYSSAFEVNKRTKEQKNIITLKGRGWGHGVGLCQIGAANMSQNGFNYQQILEHYFVGARIERIW